MALQKSATVPLTGTREPTSWFVVFATAGLFLLWVIVALAYVFKGKYIGDEGWYCLISREVLRGRALYSDVRFTQMPLLPYVYGALLRFLPQRIESGRIISFAFSTSGVFACWLIARRRYGLSAAAIALMVLVLNRAFPFDVTNVKTQAMSFALVAWALYFCSLLKGADAVASIRSAALAGLLSGLAVLARLSLLPVCVLIALFVLSAPHYQNPAVRFTATLTACAGAILLPLVVTFLFWRTAGDRFTFGIYRFHKLLGEQMMEGGSYARFIGNTILNGPAWAVCIVAGAVRLLVALIQGKNGEKRGSSDHGKTIPTFEWLVLLSWAGCTFIHATRQPKYAVYQMALPWGPAILAGWIFQRHVLPAIDSSRRAFIAGLAAIAIFPMYWQEGWIYPERSRSAAGVYDAAAIFRESPGKSLVSFDAGLAFCAPGIRLIRGYEMSDFSLVPILDGDAETEHFRGISLHRMVDDIIARADFVAIVPISLEFTPALEDKLNLILSTYFELLPLVNYYGQFGHELQMFRRIKAFSPQPLIPGRGSP